MAKKNGKSGGRKGKKKSTATAVPSAQDSGGGLMVDPARVRFQHSRIRPYFSGCGRSLMETLEDIRQNKISPSDLPLIQVIIGPADEDDGNPWYFSLNNRRLWVLKRCREEGLLGPTNLISVRVRKPKSEQESLRYSVSNCALEAKIMGPGKDKTGNTTSKLAATKTTNKDHNNQSKEEGSKNNKEQDDEYYGNINNGSKDLVFEHKSIDEGEHNNDDDSDDDESSDEDLAVVSKNPFSSLF